MSDGPPPPLPADLPPPPPAVPVPPLSPDAAFARGKARSASSCAAWALGFTVLGVLCCGGGALFGVVRFDSLARTQEAELRRLGADAGLRDEAAGLLADVADRVRPAGGEDLPPTLPEAPPKDPWGRPIRYERLSAVRARLVSAGPDGQFRTADDVIRFVESE
jgi:hypothetical protein